MSNKNGFDFTKIKKHGYVPIAKPAVHLSTKGIITFYCIDVRKKLYFRVARKGNLVGFEFSEKKFDNSFSIWRTSTINYTFSAKSKGIVKEIELAKNIGAGNFSANFPLSQDGEDIYWFDVTKPYITYEKSSKKK